MCVCVCVSVDGGGDWHPVLPPGFVTSYASCYLDLQTRSIDTSLCRVEKQL